MTEVITSAFVSSIFSGFIVWLTKTWISQRLKESIKSEYDQRLATHKAELEKESAIEIEKTKHELEKSIFEHNIKFQNIYKTRADIIAQLYKHLVVMVSSAASFSHLATFSGDASKDEKLETLNNDAKEFHKFYAEHKIYFSSTTCKRIDDLWKTVIDSNSDFAFWLQHDPKLGKSKTHDAWTAAWKTMQKEVPELMKELRGEFRDILGVTES